MSQNAPSPVLYTAKATAFAGRDGRVATDDGTLDLTVALPPGLGGKGGGTNPEQLFAAGYAACFGSAVAHVARLQKINPGPVEITARVDIGKVGEGFGLAVTSWPSPRTLERPDPRSNWQRRCRGMPQTARPRGPRRDGQAELREPTSLGTLGLPVP